MLIPKDSIEQRNNFGETPFARLGWNSHQLLKKLIGLSFVWLGKRA